MTRLTWYKRYPADFREGTRRLTFEERGLYGDVLDLIYESGNALADDDAANAHQLHADLRTFRRLKARLVGHGKLYVADGMLRNGRADAEATAAANRIALARDHAKLGGEKSRKSGTKPSDFNGSGGAGAQAGAQAGALTGIRYQEEEKKETPRAAAESVTPAPAHEAAAAPEEVSFSVEGRVLARVEAEGRDAARAAGLLATLKSEFGRRTCDSILADALRVATSNVLEIVARKAGDERARRMRVELETRQAVEDGWSADALVAAAARRQVAEAQAERAAAEGWPVVAECPRLGGPE